MHSIQILNADWEMKHVQRRHLATHLAHKRGEHSSKHVPFSDISSHEGILGYMYAKFKLSEIQKPPAVISLLISKELF